MDTLCDGATVTLTKRSFVVTCVIGSFVLFIVLSQGGGIVDWSSGSDAYRPALKSWLYKTPYSVDTDGVANDLFSDRAWNKEEREQDHALHTDVDASTDGYNSVQSKGELVLPTEVVPTEIIVTKHSKEEAKQSFSSDYIPENISRFGDDFLMFLEPAVRARVSSTERNKSEAGQNSALHSAIINAILQGNSSVDTDSLHQVKLTELAGVRDTKHSEETGQSLAHHSGDVNSPGSYLGVVTIGEQLSANTYNFIQLAYMSKLWNLSIIHPVITERSQISSVPHSYTKNTIPLGHIFNMKNVSRRLQKCFEMPPDFYFHSFNEALIKSSRDVLVLRFMVSGMSVEMKECIKESKNPINDVIKTLNYHVEKVREEATAVHGNDYKFHIWKAICVRTSPSIPASVSKVSSYLKDLVTRKRRESNSGVMVVIPWWRKFKPIRSGYYYYDPHLVYNYNACGIESFPHSDLVEKAAREFYKSLSLSQPFIGVYVRTERLIQADNQHRGYINSCLRKFNVVLRKVIEMFHIPHSNIVLVSDVGPHGSNTLRRGSKKAYSIMSRFRSWNIHSVHYNPTSFKDFPQLNVFVASVEKEFLSLSDALITVGKGGFQGSVADHFRAKHGADQLFVLCSDTGDHLPNITLYH